MEKAPLVVIDPGHGHFKKDGKETFDPGAKADGTEISESQVNDAMSARTALELLKSGLRVQLTRTINYEDPKVAAMLSDLMKDESTTRILQDLNAQVGYDILPDRFAARIAKGKGEKSLQLSIHSNYDCDTFVKGSMFLVHEDSAKDSASYALARTLAETFKVNDPQKDDDSLLQQGALTKKVCGKTQITQATDAAGNPLEGIITRSVGQLTVNAAPEKGVTQGLGATPAVIAELGYLTNPRDYQLLTSEQGQKNYAQLLARGVKQHLEPEIKRAQEATATQQEPTAPSATFFIATAQAVTPESPSIS